jgi:hypothetical protein
MNRLIQSAALAFGLSLAATGALACGPDGCGKGKDKDGKMECCCCDKMKGGHQQGAPGPGGHKPDASKPEGGKPASPSPGEHKH